MIKFIQGVLSVVAILAISLTPNSIAASPGDSYESLGRLLAPSAVVIDCSISSQVETILDQGLWNVGVTMVTTQAGCEEGEERVCAACCPESGCAPPAVCCDATCLCWCVE